ncbi:hypothetical protein [Lactiplantibacillus fabifermentans]|uniref:Uncharacterized protein n=2 Tax=Lactiplantibacillus fabifermentans TaxID=483011 RepID=W6TAW2_9LACO|nr:hypothetical protein [Lactiplantibacillus fabifermentans]ETY75727.1 hypothetical protein LFAB_00305 [Lactiplantibacillus fabifermentans T30PCM01]
MDALIRMKDYSPMKLSLSKLVAQMWQLTAEEVALSLAETWDETELNEHYTFDVTPALFKFKDIKDNPIWQNFPGEREYNSISMGPLQRYRRLYVTTENDAETLMQTRACAVLIIKVAQATHGKISEDHGESWQTIVEFQHKYQALIAASRYDVQRFSAIEGTTLGFDSTSSSLAKYLLY